MIYSMTGCGAQHVAEILRGIKLCDLLNRGSQELVRTSFESIVQVLQVGEVYVMTGSGTRCCSTSSIQ